MPTPSAAERLHALLASKCDADETHAEVADLLVQVRSEAVAEVRQGFAERLKTADAFDVGLWGGRHHSDLDGYLDGVRFVGELVADPEFDF